MSDTAPTPTPATPTPAAPQAAEAERGPANRRQRHDEPHDDRLASRLNWLRAGVLGANDGIVSVGGLVLGVAGTSNERGTLLTAGVAGLVSGAVSMALGEYVSVSSQSDTQRAALALERRELAETPEQELAELAGIYRGRGLSEQTARTVAEELTAHDALAAHAEAELGFDPEELNSPTQAAFSSFVSFTLGALIPLAAVVFPPASARVWVTFAAVLVALALTGALSARLGGARIRAAVLRLMVGGAVGLGVTYLIGRLLGTVGV